MAVYFDSSGQPRCWYCSLLLRGRASSGRCPDCNHWYTLACSRIEPGRERLMALLSIRPHDWPRRVESLRVLSIMALVLGNSAVVIGLSLLAWRQFRHLAGW